MGTRTIRLLTKGLLLLYCVCVAAKLASHPNAGQWDLNAYYFAGRAAAEGLSPYDRPAGSAAFPRWTVDFTYPPVTLPLFRLLGSLSYRGAYYTFLAAKLAALAGLVWLWTRQFVRGEADGVFCLICLLGFNGTVYADVLAGNISVFEQLALWLAFWGLLAGRVGCFCALVVAAACFKVQPIVFLGLLWLAPGSVRRRIGWLAGSLLAFGLAHAAAYAAAPGLVHGFAAQLRDLREFGPANPSTWALVQDAVARVRAELVLHVPRWAEVGTYAAVAALVLWASAKAIGRFARGGDRRAAIYVACFAYALVVPRFKDYSYILLIPPAFWAIKRHAAASAYPLLALAIVFSPTTAELPGFQGLMQGVVWPYYPLVLAYVLWAMALPRAGDGVTPGADDASGPA